MKKFYKILALILVAAMLLCTCACATGGDSRKKDKSNKDSHFNRDSEDKEKSDDKDDEGKESKEKDTSDDIVGEWECEIDLTDSIIEKIGTEAGIDFSLSERCIIVIGLDLNKDGSCKLAVNKAASSANFEKFMPSFISALVEAMYKVGEEQGASREEFDNAFIALYGCGVAEYMEQNLTMLLNTDSLFDDVEDVEGFYQVNKDQLLLSEYQDDFEEAASCEFELKGDKLTITSISENGTDVEDFMEEFNLIFPLEFKR
ncbi:MAG: hypothetical protein MJ102_04725 [Clostridia bacterium]|nr:hypothetical protein [Clostridia bacterium]